MRVKSSLIVDTDYWEFWVKGRKGPQMSLGLDLELRGSLEAIGSSPSYSFLTDKETESQRS